MFIYPPEASVSWSSYSIELEQHIRTRTQILRRVRRVWRWLRFKVQADVCPVCFGELHGPSGRHSGFHCDCCKMEMHAGCCPDDTGTPDFSDICRNCAYSD